MRGCSILLIFVVSSFGLRVAIMGMSGMGKSSLIREICHLEAGGISHSGEGTLHYQTHNNCTNHNWTVYDVPGYGTPTFPSGSQLFRDVKLVTDHILLCLSHRIYTQDVEFFESNRVDSKLGSPVTIVRVKCDEHACSDISLRLLSVQTFPGTTAFGISTFKESPYYAQIAALVDYVNQYKTE